MSAIEYPAVFAMGAVGYASMELLFRKHTHWTMLIAGGICFLLIYLISNLKHLTKPEKWLIGAIACTAVEFFIGGIVNLSLGWRVWSYAHYPMNVLGQICLAFSILWFFLCIPVCEVCILLKALFHRNGETARKIKGKERR
ncbi:MAG: hypothetical protein GX111_07190 [Clostridiales bacterium]|nr:hypothetical protein [Clostridiales bacterium]